MRISLDDKLYWRLVRLASDQELRYTDLLEKWIREHEDHRDGKTEIHPSNQPECHGMPPDIRRPRGTFSDVEIDHIRSLHREGQSAGKIAKALGRHKSSIAYAIAAMKKRGEL